MPEKGSAIAKVAKLIPSLSRESDNEVVTTVRAIGRALQSGGLDFHDLAKIVEGKRHDKPAPAPRADPDEIVPRSHSLVLANAIRRKRHFLTRENQARFDKIDVDLHLRRQLRRAEHDFLREMAKRLDV